MVSNIQKTSIKLLRSTLKPTARNHYYNLIPSIYTRKTNWIPTELPSSHTKLKLGPTKYILVLCFKDFKIKISAKNITISTVSSTILSTNIPLRTEELFTLRMMYNVEFDDEFIPSLVREMKNKKYHNRKIFIFYSYECE